jgi:hypothetical protein
MASVVPNNNHGKKATKLEVAERVAWVRERMAEGWPSFKMVHEGAALWGVSHRQAEDYLAKARKELVEFYNHNRDEFVAQRLQLLELIAHKGVETNQLSASVGAVGMVLRVVGADAPKTNG